MIEPRQTVLAIDPGSDKCGLAVVDEGGTLLFHEVAPTAALTEHLSSALRQFLPGRVLLGDGTRSRGLRPLIERAVEASGLPIAVEIVSERHTTERARNEFWRRNPPRGLWRLVPLGLQVPPVPYDDYAAYCIALDFLARPT